MTVWRTAWGSSNSYFGHRQEGLSKMMALSVFLHLFFFAFIILNQVLWKMRQPAFQGFQVNLVSPGSGLGRPGGPGTGPVRSRPSSRIATSGKGKARSKTKSGGSKKSMPALNPSRKSATKSTATQPPSNRKQRVNKRSSATVKDDPERLEEWWKKKTKALKVPTTIPTGKVTRPASQQRRTAKIDIERKSIVVPPVTLSDPSLPKSVTPPGQEQSAVSASPEQPGTNPGSGDLGNSGASHQGSSFSGVEESEEEGVGGEGGGSGTGNGGVASLGSTGGTGIIGTGGGGTGGIGTGSGGIGLGGFKFPGYLQKIDNKIRWQWAPPPVRSKEDSLVLRFDIKRNGSIDKTSIVVEESSGNTFFDQAAIRAVHAAHPFPPLPENYSEDLLRVYMNFVVQEES